MAGALDPYWIIGSAAVKLLGGDPGIIADVDVIVSRRDLAVLYAKLPLLNDPDTAKEMFASDLFGRWADPPLEVEFMAGLKVMIENRWHPVQPVTRQSIECGGYRVFTPKKTELIAILSQFGREKDLRRAATLANN